MSTEQETLQRVQSALYHLRRGLTPFVEERMKASRGVNWLNYASRAAGGAPGAALDEYGLLKTMIDNWRDVFDEAFSRADKHKVRNFLSTAFDARNTLAHLVADLQDDEALRGLDAIHSLLKAVEAPEIEVKEARALYDAQRRSGLPAEWLSASAIADPSPRPAPISPPGRPQPEPCGGPRWDDGAVDPYRIRLWASKPYSKVHRIICVALEMLPASRHNLIAELEAGGISRNPYGAISSLMTNAGNSYGRVFVERGGRLHFHPDAESEIKTHPWARDGPGGGTAR